MRSPGPYLLGSFFEAQDQNLVAGKSGVAECDSAWSGERIPRPRRHPPASRSELERRNRDRAAVCGAGSSWALWPRACRGREAAPATWRRRCAAPASSIKLVSSMKCHMRLSRLGAGPAFSAGMRSSGGAGCRAGRPSYRCSPRCESTRPWSGARRCPRDPRSAGPLSSRLCEWAHDSQRGPGRQC